MVSNIQTGEHASTGKWWASCHSSTHGECTQWGQDEYEALDNLRQYVEVHYDELWPSVEVVSSPRWGQESCSACRFIQTTFVKGTGLVDWWLHVPSKPEHTQLVSLIGRYGSDGPDYWSWPAFMFEKADAFPHAFEVFPAKAALDLWKRNIEFVGLGDD